MNSHDKILEDLRKTLPQVNHIKGAFLYGSVARGEQTPNSDIDVALWIDEDFLPEILIDAINQSFREKPDYLWQVALREKTVLHFLDRRLKVELSYNKKIENFRTHFIGSEIPLEKIDHAIIFDKDNILSSALRNFHENENSIHFSNKRERLIQKFQYEFESCSSYHRRSDGYRFYFFYNIALHCAIQLRHLIHGNGRFNFLPRYFIPECLSKEQMPPFYELNGALFLEHANDKKRKLLDFFYETLCDCPDVDPKTIKDFLEEVFDRDYFWNFRDASLHNPRLKKGILFRTATLTLFQESSRFDHLLNKTKIRTVVDLRAAKEIAERSYSDTTLAKFKYVHAPLDPWNQPEWFRSQVSPGTPEEIAYRFFGIGCKESYSKAIRTINETEGAVAIHCFAGKDRTGIFFSLLHLLSGATPETVYTDYLASEVDVKTERLDIVLNIVKEAGGILPYLLSCGLSEDEINSVKQKIML